MNYQKVIVTLTSKKSIENVVQILSVVGVDSHGNEFVLSNLMENEYFTENPDWKNDVRKTVSQNFKLNTKLIDIDDDIIYV